MRISGIAQYAPVFVLLAFGCFDSNGEENGLDSESDSSDETVQADGAEIPNTDSSYGNERSNECQDAKEIRLSAIQDKCREPLLTGCCYCKCELTDESLIDEPNCNCADWMLIRNQPDRPCVAADLNSSIACLNDRKSCEMHTQSAVTLFCSN